MNRYFFLITLFLLCIISLQSRAASSDTLDQQRFLPLVIDQTVPERQFSTEFLTTIPEQHQTDLHPIGDSSILVVTQVGVIFQVDAMGALQTEPFLDLSHKVQFNGAEQGMFSIALHPDFAENGRFFVTYTRQNDDGMAPYILSRFELDAANPSVADPNSELVVLEIAQSAANHQGGSLEFDANGYLFVSVGDDGNGNNSADLTTLKGKLLRLDVDSAEPYAIPSDNPFVNDAKVRQEIWAYGLRNPWRVWLDHVNDQMFIADVGWFSAEEINVETLSDGGGLDYGWPCYEGRIEIDPARCDESAEYTMPVHTYSHTDGRCSITGGAVYNGSLFPSWRGDYIFADFCTTELFALSQDAHGRWVSRWLGTAGAFVSSIGVDQAGELYVAGFGTDKVRKIVPLAGER